MTTMYVIYELKDRIAKLEGKVEVLEAIIKNLHNSPSKQKDYFAPPYTVTCGVQNENA